MMYFDVICQALTYLYLNLRYMSYNEHKVVHRIVILAMTTYFILTTLI